MFNRCLIAGLGLMGGSLALAMREKNLAKQYIGVDSDPEHCKKALHHRLVDKVANIETTLPDVDFIALCTPVEGFPEILRKLPRHLPANVLVIDLASVKMAAIRHVFTHLPDTLHANYVPCHPITGAATYGPDAATSDLYKGHDIILSPHPTTSEASMDRARSLWRALGSTTRLMDPEKHDRAYAYVSHLPQLLAYAYLLAYGDTLDPKGLEQWLRIGGSNPNLWHGIFLANRDALLLALDDFQLEMRHFPQYSAYGQMQASLRAIVGEYANYAGPGFRDFTLKLPYSVEKALPDSPLPLHHEIATLHSLLVEGNDAHLLSQLRKAKAMHNRCFG